jgi:rhamnose utilization protein RhaD (predicted bifunctional aldolase and dehydrogenase)
MESRWRSAEAAAFEGAVGECVYCSRLIGSDPSLVLHGGGNSSVKVPYRDVTARDIDVLHVKGSGWDMGPIKAPGFSPLRLSRLHELLELDSLTDVEMMRELAAAGSTPRPPIPRLSHCSTPSFRTLPFSTVTPT